MPDQSPENERRVEFYCPQCNCPVSDVLVCGDCLAVICRVCGAPLEKADDLGVE
jgi:hypothetical protein